MFLKSQSVNSFRGDKFPGVIFPDDIWKEIINLSTNFHYMALLLTCKEMHEKRKKFFYPGIVCSQKDKKIRATMISLTDHTHVIPECTKILNCHSKKLPKFFPEGIEEISFFRTLKETIVLPKSTQKLYFHGKNFLNIEIPPFVKEMGLHLSRGEEIKFPSGLKKLTIGGDFEAFPGFFPESLTHLCFYRQGKIPKGCFPKNLKRLSVFDMEGIEDDFPDSLEILEICIRHTSDRIKFPRNLKKLCMNDLLPNDSPLPDSLEELTIRESFVFHHPPPKSLKKFRTHFSVKVGKNFPLTLKVLACRSFNNTIKMENLSHICVERGEIDYSLLPNLKFFVFDDYPKKPLKKIVVPETNQTIYKYYIGGAHRVPLRERDLQDIDLSEFMF